MNLPLLANSFKYTRQISLPKRLDFDLALIIQGVRRGGKSTLLSQLPKHYDILWEQCYYCNNEANS